MYYNGDKELTQLINKVDSPIAKIPYEAYPHYIEDGITYLKTNEGTEFKTKNILIAAGAGSFEPRRPPNIDNPDSFLNKGVTYAVKDKTLFKDKTVFIFMRLLFKNLPARHANHFNSFILHFTCYF